MKTLANTSPFLLLLVPVFVMILLTFAKVGSDNRNEDIVSKVPTTQNSPIKVRTSFFR